MFNIDDSFDILLFKSCDYFSSPLSSVILLLENLNIKRNKSIIIFPSSKRSRVRIISFISGGIFDTIYKNEKLRFPVIKQGAIKILSPLYFSLFLSGKSYIKIR